MDVVVPYKSHEVTVIAPYRILYVAFGRQRRQPAGSYVIDIISGAGGTAIDLFSFSTDKHLGAVRRENISVKRTDMFAYCIFYVKQYRSLLSVLIMVRDYFLAVIRYFRIHISPGQRLQSRDILWRKDPTRNILD